MATTIACASQAPNVCTCNTSPTRGRACGVCRAPIILAGGSSEDRLEPLKEEIDSSTAAQSGPPPARNECATSLPTLRRNYAQANLRERLIFGILDISLFGLYCTGSLYIVRSPEFGWLGWANTKIMASAITAVRRGVDPLRLQALRQLQCSIFATTYNPTNARNGAKYLKGRLRGPSMVQYYPPRITFKDIEHILAGQFGVTDLAEQERLDDVEERKRRGKGTPKKAKTKEDSRRAAKKRR